MDFRKLSSKEKALRINLDPHIYGSFAEIGAGQDVAAIFFKAGGASGTIAKTMSAYDMAFSDAIYGPEESRRYVCEPRLSKMIDKEFSLMEKRLPHRANNTAFFAFADTVEALNFKRTNQGHGWLGLRFQLRPNTPPNDCVIHVRLFDNDTLQQQQAIGIIGVNLIYACYYMHEDPVAMLDLLVEEINPGRVEIDYFKLTGPDFDDRVDNRLMSLKLVKKGLANATMFGPDGEVMQPADSLYKRNILILRGRFRPPTHVNVDMLETGTRQFFNDKDVDPDRTTIITELTLSNLQSEGGIDENDFLDRVNILCSMGQTVMISNYHEYYRLIAYLSSLNRKRKIGIILGLYNLMHIFDEKYYEFLPGGILESFGTLFGNNVKLFVYPSYKAGTREIQTTEHVQIPTHLRALYQYLTENNKIEDIQGFNKDILHIISDNVLAMIKSGIEGWEKYVPDVVAQAIKADCLFDYPCEVIPPHRQGKN